MPMMIDGKPLRTSSQSLICSPTGFGANSLTKIATRIPTGSAIAVAIATSMSVPTNAGAIPPPVSPNTAGPFVKKSRLSACQPRASTEPTTIASTATARSAARTATATATRFHQSRRRERPVAFSEIATSLTVPPRAACSNRWTIRCATKFVVNVITSRISPR